jgi:hypothetical protein
MICSLSLATIKKESIAFFNVILKIKVLSVLLVDVKCMLRSEFHDYRNREFWHQSNSGKERLQEADS